MVRIGRDDSNSKHTVCSKTTTNRDNCNTTTTTKITIDLTPSPTNEDKNTAEPLFQRFSRPPSHSFKSTSLILSTIKTDSNVITDKTQKIPQQLEALRKLYEDVQSDSEADKEVQSLMSKTESYVNKADDASSVLSGSWSKMHSFKNINQYFNKTAGKISKARISALHAHVEKGISKAM